MSNTLIQRVTLTTFLVGALALAASPSTAEAQTTTARRGIRVTKDGGRTEATSGGEVTSSRPSTATSSTAPTTSAAPSTNSLSGSTTATTSTATSTAPSTTSGVTGSVTSPSSPSATSSPTSTPATSSSTVDTTGLRTSNGLAPSTNSGSTANPTAGTTLRDTTNANASTSAPPAPSMDMSNMPGMGSMTMDVSSWTDANVIAHLASGDSMEVQAANLAQTRAQRADVRDFAATLARDHQQNLTQLLALAPQTGFSPTPAANDSSAMHAQQGMSMLTSLQGTAFDSAFVAAQVMHHQMDLTMLQQLRGRAQSAQLRTLIDQTIPVIQTHLDRARALAAQ